MTRRRQTGMRSWGCLGWGITIGMGGIVLLCITLPIFAVLVGGSGENLGGKLVQALLAIAIATLMVSLSGILITRNSEAERNDGRPVDYAKRTAWRKRWSIIALVSCAAAFLLAMLMAAITAMN